MGHRLSCCKNDHPSLEEYSTKIMSCTWKNVWSQNSGCWLLLNRLASCFLRWWLMTIVNRHDIVMIIVNQDKDPSVCLSGCIHIFHLVVLYLEGIYWYTTSILDELKAESDLRPAQIRWWFHEGKLPNFVWWKWQCWATQALMEPNPKPKSTKQKSWWSVWKRMPKGQNHGENRLLHRWYYWELNESRWYFQCLVWHQPFLNFSLRVASGTHYRIWDVLKVVLASTFLVRRSSPTSPSKSCPCQPCNMAFHSGGDGCALMRGLEIAHLWPLLCSVLFFQHVQPLLGKMTQIRLIVFNLS